MNPTQAQTQTGTPHTSTFPGRKVRLLSPSNLAGSLGTISRQSDIIHGWVIRIDTGLRSGREHHFSGSDFKFVGGGK